MIGKRLSHYVILEEIGAGGMGVVYRARDEHLPDRDVAIKVLPPGTIADEAARRQFRKEALALSRLSHPHIETIHDFDTQEGVDFLVLELVAGVTLAERLRTGPIPEREAVRLGVQLAEGLAAAHRQGILHRDIKPGNLRVTPDGQLKVLDFGLAKHVLGGAEATTETITETGRVAGTLPYMAPEQLLADRVDARTDLWAAGAVLYEMATGQGPFREDVASRLADAIIHQAPPNPRAVNPRLSPELERIVLKCLEKDPESRYQGAKELAVDLRRLGTLPSGSGTRQTRRALRRRWIAMAAGTVAAITAGVLAWHAGLLPGFRPQAPVPGEKGLILAAGGTPSIAVLPFADLSPGKDQEYFTDGLSEELLTVLANVRGLRVVSRTSAFSFKGKGADLATVAQKLNVAIILEGSVRKVGKRLRITAQLIHVATDSHLWSQTYDRELEDIFAVQKDIAQSVVREARAALLGEKPDPSASAVVADEVAAAAKGRGENAEAYRLYLQGRFFADRFTHADMAKGIEYYRRALQLDPGYALAWAWLSDGLVNQAEMAWVPFSEGFANARAAAARALQLNPDLPEGHWALGRVRLFHDWNWKGAEASMQRALELAPGNVDAVRGAADVAASLGRLEEAIALHRRAVALDPLSVAAHRNLAYNCFNAALLDEAEAELKKAIDLSPESGLTHNRLGFVHLAQGRVDEAMTDSEREPDEAWRLHLRTMVYHAKGQRAESEAALRRLIEMEAEEAAVQVAETYAYRGQADLAFQWLERAYRQRDPGLAEMKVDVLLRNVHADPRWKRFLKKMGLAD